jgi:hypothetical protein
MLDLTEQLERYAAALGDAVPERPVVGHGRRRRLAAIAAAVLGVIGVAGGLVLNTGSDDVSVGSDGAAGGWSEQTDSDSPDGEEGARHAGPTADALTEVLAVALPTYEVELATDEDPAERVVTQVTVRSGGTLVSVVVLDAAERSAFVERATPGDSPPVTLASGALVIRDESITTQLLFPLSETHMLNFASQAYGPDEGRPLSLEQLDAVAAQVSEALGADSTSASPEPRPQTSASVRVELWHCGVRPVEFDGRSWLASTEIDRSTAPLDFGGTGTMRLVDESTAVYTDAESGQVIEFSPLVGEYQPPPCR